MNKRISLLTALAVSSTCYAANTNAEESKEKLDDLEVTGQLSHHSAIKSDTPIIETARSISIETEQQIRDKGALALDDSYGYTSGVIGETYGYATRGDWIKIRGLDVPQYQDSLQSLFGNYNNTRPHIYTLEQVEILKGPASVLYGKGSPGGLVNVVSKRPKEKSQTEIAVEAGNFDHKQIAIDSTGKIAGSDEWLYRMVMINRDADTQVDHVEDNQQVFAPSITWRPNNDTNITVMLNHTKTEGDTAAQFLPITGTLNPAANGKRMGSSTYLGEPDFNVYDAETTSATIIANHQINEVWNAEINARYTDAEAEYKQAWPAFTGFTLDTGALTIAPDRYVYINANGALYNDGTVPRSFYSSDANSQQKAVDLRLRGKFSTGSADHDLLIGSQYQHVTTDDDGYYIYFTDLLAYGDSTWINAFDPEYGNLPPNEVLEAAYSENPATTTKDTGFYISDQITVDQWIFTAGIRYDETNTKNHSDSKSQDDEAFSSSAGVLYQFENGLSPYISYAESFEPVIGLDINDGTGKPLKPQEGKQKELGLKFEPASFPGLFTLAYFDIEQTNLKDPNSPAGSYRQSGDANIKGVEFEGQAKLGDFSVELNLTNLDSESADGFQIASVPEKQASTWVSYRTSDKWNGFKTGVGVRYVGSSLDGADNFETPSYTLGDFMVGYEVDKWDIALNVRNVEDKEYLATCLSRGDCFYGSRRTVIGSARYKF